MTDEYQHPEINDDGPQPMGLVVPVGVVAVAVAFVLVVNVAGAAVLNVAVNTMGAVNVIGVYNVAVSENVSNVEE